MAKELWSVSSLFFELTADGYHHSMDILCTCVQLSSALTYALILTIVPELIDRYFFLPQPVLGVNAPKKALLFVIASPVGPYYKSGFRAVRLLADTKYVRAWPGGTGNIKCGG